MVRDRRTIFIFSQNHEAIAPGPLAIRTTRKPDIRVSPVGEIFSAAVPPHGIHMAVGGVLTRHRHHDRPNTWHPPAPLAESDPCARHAGRRTAAGGDGRVLA